METHKIVNPGAFPDYLQATTDIIQGKFIIQVIRINTPNNSSRNSQLEFEFQFAFNYRDKLNGILYVHRDGFYIERFTTFDIPFRSSPFCSFSNPMFEDIDGKLIFTAFFFEKVAEKLEADIKKFSNDELAMLFYYNNLRRGIKRNRTEVKS